MDARAVSTSFAEGIRYICELSKDAVNSKILIFLSDSFYTPYADPTTAERKVIELRKNIPETAVSQVVSILNTFSYAASGESAISGLGTNIVVYASAEIPMKLLISRQTYRNEDTSYCSCLPTIKCPVPATIYSDSPPPTPSIFYVNASNNLIKGMKADCYPYDALTVSTLECFYDLACIELLVSDVSNFRPLNASLPSKFFTNETIESLAYKLMAEEYWSSYSVENYYLECGPPQCIYTYTHYSTYLTVITTIIGLIGGLNTLLQIAVPKIVLGLIRLKQTIFPTSTSNVEVITVINIPKPGNVSIVQDSFLISVK